MPAKTLWLTLGLLATACGVAGIVLPFVPTTPFLLLAAFAFARSSPRLHTWLVTHPRLGPPINDWRRHGAISRRGKLAAVALMAATLGFSVASGARAWIIVVQAIVLMGAAAFVLSRPWHPGSASRKVQAMKFFTVPAPVRPERWGLQRAGGKKRSMASTLNRYTDTLCSGRL